MTKQELIDRIDAILKDDMATKHIGKSAVGHVLDTLGDVAAAELRSGGEVSLPGLGKLVVSATAARTGRNPRTGAAVEIPASRRVGFRTGKALKEALK